MNKFSIIVPVYNVENYLKKCLDSIINQTYKSFEIIIVNDGSTDNSQEIIDKYSEEYPNDIKAFQKKNGGLSDARNFGVLKSNGDYILFVDSDDYIDELLLEKLNDIIVKENFSDIIGFSLESVDGENNHIEKIEKPEFYNLTGEEAIIKLINSKKYFESVCYYAYKRKFWIENKFMFYTNKYHEDFGLIPIVILKAKNVSCINFVGYYYFQTQNSITRNNDIEKEKKRAYDLLFHFDYIRSQICNMKISDINVIDVLNNYIAGALLYRLNNINKLYKKGYKNELKNRKIYKFFPSKNLKEKIKKILLFIRLYV